MSATLLLMACLLGAPEPEVPALIQAQVQAWNRGDLPAFCALYAEDAVFLSPSGLTKGRQAVLDRYQKKYGGDRAGMGTLSIEPIEQRRIPSDRPLAVTVAARWKLVWPDKPAAEGLTLIVFERRQGRWQLVQDASM